MNQIEQIVKLVSELKVVDLVQLISVLKHVWGLNTESEETKKGIDGYNTSCIKNEKLYEVVLMSFGQSKINVIKEVRLVLGLGLKEAKEFVESVPKTVKSGVEKAEAEKVKLKLEAAGAIVEVR
ncbi:MAG: 50S ribosomal protein L7/L12 [Candidatus Hodgkinia cicadicola]